MTMPLDSALLTKLNILFFLLLALLIYDLQYRQKMQEVSLRNAELETTQAALLDAQNHKDEFIASVGYELRTPMNAILGLNGVLLDELAGQPQQAQAALHIREATDQLLRVVTVYWTIRNWRRGAWTCTTPLLHWRIPC
jgi:signal transduction histidine kinase